MMYLRYPITCSSAVSVLRMKLDLTPFFGYWCNVVQLLASLGFPFQARGHVN